MRHLASQVSFGSTRPALGAPAIEWVRVQRALADDAVVCLYDRAGLGWSDPAPWPRTASRMADELHELLLAADVRPPYVLVGHSMGGYVARLFAARQPDSLAGMVLVDSSHEDQFQRLAPFEQRTLGADRSKLRALQRQLRPLGIVRASVDLGINTEPHRDALRECPADLVDVGVALALTSSHRRAVVQELLGFEAGAAEVRAETRHLDTLPLTVVTGGSTGREQFGDGWNVAWQGLQNELTRLSERGTQLVADHTGHHVQHDDPALVAGTIRELVEHVRRRSSQARAPHS
ncbi:MAG: alpha/beta fold hydrolase [Pseudonocardiaceae bacterium]|nr:alpha/beta fold hydrolase [Pseudonocardiaceae bacterium]